MKAAYITTYNARDIHQWSGLGYYIGKSLEDQSIALEYLGSLKNRYSVITTGKEYLYKLLRTDYLSSWDNLILKAYAVHLTKELKKYNNLDLLIGPGPIPFVYLDTKLPIVTWTDSCFPGLLDFYTPKNKFSKQSINNGKTAQQLALNKSTLSIYASHWAASIAINEYKVNPSKVKVVPFGANVENSRNLEEIKTIVSLRSTKKCKLLFMGVEWFRKGGDIVIEIAKELNKSGLDTELTVVGCKPITKTPLPDFIKSIGFISKSTKEGQKIINDLLTKSHFLVVPSRAEAYGLVFCEANSYGVPDIATDVGGIPTIIKDGINGKAFSVSTGISEYCNYILDLFNNYQQYIKLALSSYNEFKTRLNWKVAGQTVKKLLTEVVEIR